MQNLHTKNLGWFSKKKKSEEDIIPSQLTFELEHALFGDEIQCAKERLQTMNT